MITKEEFLEKLDEVKLVTGDEEHPDKMLVQLHLHDEDHILYYAFTLEEVYSIVAPEFLKEKLSDCL